jgi:quercetin dioxygenase-like cupin family protein
LQFPADFPTTRLMKIVRLFTGADNESHFEEIDVELNFKGKMEVSELQPAHGIVFRRAPATHLSNFHNAPRRQYVITLAGQVEIETGDGSVRRFGPGDVMLADDTTGHGHITRVIGGQPRRYVMIPLK